MTTPAAHDRRHARAGTRDVPDVSGTAQDVPDVPAAARTSQEAPENVPDVPDVPDVLGELEGAALHAQLRADTALLTAAAAALRHAATQGAYRGRPRPDHAYALASALEMARMRWLDQDPALRARLRTCSHILLDTTPGRPDPEPAPDQRR